MCVSFQKSQQIYLRPNASQINYVPNGHYLVAVSGNKRELFEPLVLQDSTAEFSHVVYNEGNQVILEKGTVTLPLLEKRIFNYIESKNN